MPGPFPQGYTTFVEQRNRTAVDPGTRANAAIVNALQAWVQAAETYYGVKDDAEAPSLIGSHEARLKYLEQVAGARVMFSSAAPATPLEDDVWGDEAFTVAAALKRRVGAEWVQVGANAAWIGGKPVSEAVNPEAGQTVVYDATAEAWEYGPLGFANPMTAKGQLIVQGTENPEALAPGIAGQVLVVTALDTLGWQGPQFKGLGIAAIPQPAITSVTAQGTPGAASYSYYLVAEDARGRRTMPSPVAAIGTGHATLDATNFNRLTWAAVPGAVNYHVLKGTTSLRLATVAAPTTTYDDQGGATAAYTPPTRNETADWVMPGYGLVDGGLLDFGDGAGATVSTTGRARIVYDHTLAKFRASVNGGAYVDLGAGGGSSLAVHDEALANPALPARNAMVFTGAGVTATDDPAGSGSTVITIPGGGGSGDQHVIQDETTPLTARASLAFVGPGVTVTDDAAGGRTVVTIPGGSGGGSGHAIYFGSSALATQPILAFLGAGVVVTDDAAGGRTIVNIPGGIGGGGGAGITVYDEGVPLDQRSFMKFTGPGVAATDDGTFTVITIPGSVAGHAILNPAGATMPTQAGLQFLGAGVSVANGSGVTQVTVATPAVDYYAEQADDPASPPAGQFAVYAKLDRLWGKNDAGEEAPLTSPIIYSNLGEFPPRRFLEFNYATGLEVEDDEADDTTRVNFTGGGGGITGIDVSDEGAETAEVTALDFVGDGVSVVNAGGVSTITIPGGGGGGSGASGLILVPPVLADVIPFNLVSGGSTATLTEVPGGIAIERPTGWSNNPLSGFYVACPSSAADWEYYAVLDLNNILEATQMCGMFISNAGDTLMHSLGVWQGNDVPQCGTHHWTGHSTNGSSPSNNVWHIPHSGNRFVWRIRNNATGNWRDYSISNSEGGTWRVRTYTSPISGDHLAAPTKIGCFVAPFGTANPLAAVVRHFGPTMPAWAAGS